MIERKITIGLITSTDFITQIYRTWDLSLLSAPICKRISEWCIIYYDKYGNAPGKNIEGIYHQKLKEGLNKDLAEGIEEMLEDLSDEYLAEDLNVNYLLDQTYDYFRERSIENHCDSMKSLLLNNELNEAEKEANNYSPISGGSKEDLDLHDDVALDRVKKAFNISKDPLIKYPGRLGEFWNDQLIRGGFVALMATEKRGKTFWKLDLAMRAAKQNRKVAFFQAGDMTEDQQLRRLCIYLNKKSDSEKYCGEMYEPVKDCIYNQLDTCDKDERECDYGVFSEYTKHEVQKEFGFKHFESVFQENDDYKPCYNCRDWKYKKLGAVWFKKIEKTKPLSENSAVDSVRKVFTNKRKFKLSSHPNGTLSVKQIRALLAVWEKEDDFIPDVVIIDYADLLICDSNRVEFRHQQNEIWKSLRSLSQEKDSLVITSTQADAGGYEKDTLDLKNFSEDKRKYGHVTAMFGLNQDKKGREKSLGVMRLNELIKREGDFNINNQVTILQNLKRGRPFLTSF